MTVFVPLLGSTRKKQKNCDPTDPADDHQGDYWDHVAYDPEHRLVLAVVPGARSIENAEEIVAEVKDRLGARPPALVISDEYPAYASALEAVYAEPVASPPRRPGLCHGAHGAGEQPPASWWRSGKTSCWAAKTRWSGPWESRRAAGRSTRRSSSGSTPPTGARMRGSRGGRIGSVRTGRFLRR
jgi:hypothetical protein